MLFIEASAKTREGVQCAFEELIEKVLGLFHIMSGIWSLYKFDIKGGIVYQ